MPYFGGKQSTAPAIVELLPPHGHYVEPYAGSLAVLLAKPPSAHETVNDLDRELVTFWRTLRDQPDKLARACALTPHARVELAEADVTATGNSDLEVARRVFVRLTQGRAAQMTAAGWRHYVHPAGSSASMPRYLAGYVGRMAAVAQRLQGVSLECMPALDIVAKYGDSAEVLLYVDPPYLGVTRTSGGYRHDMKTAAEHRALAEALHEARASVVISGYASDLYDRDLYSDWSRYEIVTGTGQGNTWRQCVEVLWANRPLGQQPALFEGAWR